MNEGIYRSPKWLRNIADFEINTGDDIKGEPSKKMQKKLDEEERKRIAEAEEIKKKQDAADEKLFDNLLTLIIKYITSEYKICNISVESGNIRIKKDNITYKEIEINFDVLLKTNIIKPTFDISVKYGTKQFNYTVSGNFYTTFKTFISTVIYGWYKLNNSSNSSKSYTDSDYDNDYNKYYGNKKTDTNSNKQESEEVKSKRKIYNKLKDTLDGFSREYVRLLNDKTPNPNKKRDEDILLNQITNVKEKISKMKIKYKFEGYQCTHFKNFYEML